MPSHVQVSGIILNRCNVVTTNRDLMALSLTPQSDKKLNRVMTSMMGNYTVYSSQSITSWFSPPDYKPIIDCNSKPIAQH